MSEADNPDARLWVNPDAVDAAAPTCDSCGVLMDLSFFHFRHCMLPPQVPLDPRIGKAVAENLWDMYARDSG